MWAIWYSSPSSFHDTTLPPQANENQSQFMEIMLITTRFSKIYYFYKYIFHVPNFMLILTCKVMKQSYHSL